MSLLRDVANVVREQGLMEVARRVRRRLSCEFVSLGLRRDLARPWQPQASTVPLSVRPIRESDGEFLFREQEPLSRLEREMRLDLLDAGIRTCYVAVTPDGEPCGMQWLIGSAENERVQAHFHGSFPVLAPDEALVEYAYVRRAFEGRNVLACMLTQVAAIARQNGLRWLVTFPSAGSLVVQYQLKRLGFVQYGIQRDRWWLFRRRITFSRMEPGQGPSDRMEACRPQVLPVCGV